MLFDNFWKSFDGRFQGILESLRRHRDLIDKEANALNIAENRPFRREVMDEFEMIQKWRNKSLEDMETQERERLGSQMREAVAWLGASPYQEDIFERHLRASKTTKCKWIFQNAHMSLWLREGRFPEALWINGKPGAGQ